MRNLLFTLLLLLASTRLFAIAPITGSLVVCEGFTVILNDVTPGGIWTSGEPAVASISSAMGIVSGNSAGVAHITYTVGTESVYAAVTVNPMPAAVPSATLVCGTSVALTCTTPGGVWSKVPDVIAYVDAVGVVTPAAAGSAGTSTITYTLPTGCYTTTIVSVQLFPPAITGGGSQCVGTTAPFYNSVAGGTWSTSDPSVITISSAGVATNVAAGSADIIYTVPGGCSRSLAWHSNPLPPPITGVATVCSGATTTLSDDSVATSWSSSNPGVATVDMSGVVTGISAGTVMITFVGQCTATTMVTVTGPAAIYGTPTLCTGYTTLLAAPDAGGTWSSGNTAVATVDASGLVTGVAGGTAAITYTSGCGYTTRTVTVAGAISPITGATTGCEGASLFVSDATLGGTWSSSNIAVATINSAGIISGLAPGTATIDYTTLSCGSVSTVVTINPNPLPITGTLEICMGTSSTLSSTPSGGTWASSNIAVALVDFATGMLTGINAGSTFITYYSTAGCHTVAAVTIMPTPAAISGPSILCLGSGIILMDVSAGGIWSTTSPVLNIDATGNVTGLAAGTGTVTYSNTFGCYATHDVTATFACTGAPVAGTAVATGANVYTGMPDTLSLAGTTIACGIAHQWQSSPDGVSWADIPGATEPGCIQSPAASAYYRCALTCIASASTVYSAPVYVSVHYAILSHTKIDTVCDITHFRTTTAGITTAYTLRTWFGDGSNNLVTVSAAGVGNVYHTYTASGSYTVRQVLYYSGAPVDSIMFTYVPHTCHSLQVGLYYDLNSNCAQDAGEPYNNVPMLVRIDSAGVPVDTVSTLGGFYYNATGGPGTVYSFMCLPAAGGMSVSCPLTGVLYDTIDATTVVYPTRKFAFSCGGAAAYDLAVHTSAIAGRHTYKLDVTVTNNYCFPTSPTLTVAHSPKYSYTPLTYSSYYTSPLPATITGNTLTWAVGTIAPYASQTVTLYLERPYAIGWLTPGDTVMNTISISLGGGDIDTTNNNEVRIDTVKSSYDPNHIAVSPEGSVLPCTELLYAIQFENDGNDTARNIHVLDTLAAGLDVASLRIVSASALMDASILYSGPYTIIDFDFPGINLPDSSHHGLCTGMLQYTIKTKTGLTDGTTMLAQAGIYFDDNPVVMTNNVTTTTGINPIVSAAFTCTGDTIACTDATPGGIWGGPTSAIISPAGTGILVSGLPAGTATISYTVANACASRTALRSITVGTLPTVAALTGAGTLCAGAASSLASATPGGTWHSSDAAIATIDAAGSVSGLAAGTVTISYSVANACGPTTATAIVTVNPLVTPAVSTAATPGLTICQGASVTLTATPTYGGTTPGYSWIKDGIPVGVGSTFTFTPANGNVINCLMTSSYPCVLTASAAALPQTFTVTDTATPAITVTETLPPLYTSGDPILFTATTTATGLAYQWYINGAPAAGATGSTFTTNPLPGDVVMCIATSTAACGGTGRAQVVAGSSAGIPTTGINEIKLYPNPNQGIFALTGTLGTQTAETTLTITNTLGQTIYTQTLTATHGQINTQIDLGKTLPAGAYTLHLQSNNQTRNILFLLRR